jgi:RHS repeat-associated protein
MIRLLTTAFLMMAPLAMAQTRGRFVASADGDPIVGHYLVTLADDSVEVGLAAEELAKTYGGTLEPYSAERDRRFAVAMLPSRARLMSEDGRVTAVVEQPRRQRAAAPVAGPTRVDLPEPAAATTAGRLVPHTTSTQTSERTLTYDGAGNIKGFGNDEYRYDTAQRLVKATVRDITGSYSYDGFGNRKAATGETNCAGQSTCAPTVTVDSATNHLTTSGITSDAVTYDAAGNVEAASGGIYTYDGTGMMTRAKVDADDRQFIYTADDERIAVRQGQSWTWTVRGLDNKVLREFTSLEPNGSPGQPTTARAWKKDYIWRDGMLLATKDGSATLHFHLDHLGTPLLITDANGAKVGEHAYYPFGAEINVTPHESPEEAMKFTGHERDTVAGDGHTLDDMHARYYSPTMGRFLSVDRHPGDPRRPQSWNRYVYASNNPIVRIDLDGNADFYVTTTFSHGEFHDDRVTDYLSYNATNFDISNGSATPKNFQKGLSDPDGVSIYFGHSNTADSLLFNKAGFVPFSNFSNRNAVTCISACNSSAIIKDAKVGPGQALLGVTSNLKAGFVKAGDLSYVSTQLIAGLKAGKTVGQIVDGLNKYFGDRAKKDPNYKVQVTINGDRDIVVK